MTELDNLWSDDYGSGFYDSCKDVKFSATGGKVMDFIGGGAKNYTSFLKFLGDEKPFGSPFQINFPRPKGYEEHDMEAVDQKPKACNDTDKTYRCACVDCPGACPAALPPVQEQEYCYVGALPCLSFTVIVIYAVFLLLVVTAVSGHVVYHKRNQRRSERLRLLQDAAPSDDEDEGDPVHNAGVLDRLQKNYSLNSTCDSLFNWLGGTCARYPLLTIGASIIVIVLLSLGWLSFEIETDPVRLWVSPSSAAAEEKAFFDSNFGPFYRAEQAFLVNDTGKSGPGPVLSYETLAWWFDIESQAQRMTSEKYGLTLKDVCFNPTGSACVVQSLTGYFGDSFSNVGRESWEKQLRHCTEQPGSQECLPGFQLPLQPGVVLGGWEKTGDILDSEALIVTWVVDNHPEGSAEEARAKDWERRLKKLLLSAQDEATEKGLRLSFNTEISLEEELNKSGNTDAKIVIISYIVMFFYASLALGSATISAKSLMHNPASALVESKFTLGIFGILIVLMSVSASVGFFSATGIKVTLIIAEVIPFLVLAVGVDNIFLIVHEFERVNHCHPDEPLDIRVAKTLGRMGPSILLSASTETITFAMGAFAGMPAVRNFAVYAAGAVLINAILQVTMFVSVLTLNQKRVDSRRADCFPLIKIGKADKGDMVEYGSDEQGPLQRYIRKFYAPFLLDRKIKVAVVVGFLGLFTAGLALIPKVALGLDQRLAIPEGSYMINYFNDLYAYLGTGPPVYFVTRDLDATKRVHQQEICGRFSTCDEFSLATTLEQESKRPNVSYISGATASWIDDFFFWLNPAYDSCCRENGQVCFENRSPPWNTTLYGMPEGEEFIHYLSKWLDSPTGEDCPLGGKASYKDAVIFNPNTTTVPASHFRTFHTPLHSQADYINSYASARRIADTVSDHQNITVFPYSKFYIFFDQYSTIVPLTGVLLGCAIAVILILSSILLGSFATGLVVTLTVTMIVVDVIGAMALFNVSLNAISLVNLIICVGIGVEFCAHIARAFMFPASNILDSSRNRYRGRDARAWTALVNVGGSVFTGITLTKLLGVSVLAFTTSKIFEVYFFRIWMSLVVLASVHALVFLPVALSLVGGDGEFFPFCSLPFSTDTASALRLVISLFLLSAPLHNRC